MTTLAQSRPVDGEPTRRFGLRLRRRHVWLVPGLGIALFANAQAGTLHVGLFPLLLFGIVPHLTVLVGIGQPHARGQLAPRAVPLFNTMHWPVLPLAVLGLAAAGVLPPFWFVGALAWLSHIVVDRGFGDGPGTVDRRAAKHTDPGASEGLARRYRSLRAPGLPGLRRPNRA